MDIEQQILRDMQIALDNTILKMVGELRRFIQTELYDAYDPTWYERTMQILDLWEEQPSVISGNSVEGSISPVYSNLKTNKNKNQHIITGETLIDMLINGYGNQSMPYNQPRDFFTPFIQWVNGNFDRIFKENMDNPSVKTFIK